MLPFHWMKVKFCDMAMAEHVAVPAKFSNIVDDFPGTRFLCHTLTMLGVAFTVPEAIRLLDPIGRIKHKSTNLVH